jgi:multidrug efflux pump subunit AcrA (membrane-fusion protein)
VTGRGIAWLGALLVALLACSDEPPPSPPPVPVAVATVEKRDVPFELEAPGAVEPLETVAVRAQVGGVLDSVAFQEGDDVRKGQVLFQIDPRPYRAVFQQAQAALERDRAQAENARQNPSATASSPRGTTSLPSSSTRSAPPPPRSRRPWRETRPPWTRPGSTFSSPRSAPPSMDAPGT